MLFDLLERLSSLTRVWFREHPLLADIQPIQLSALLYLARCNGYSNTPLAVADYLGLTKGTVSQSLKALEAKGLISKSQDARDKRSVHLLLTEQARTLLAEVMPPAFSRPPRNAWAGRPGAGALARRAAAQRAANPGRAELRPVQDLPLSPTGRGRAFLRPDRRAAGACRH